MTRRWILVVAALAAAACGEESPTDIGGSLLPGQSVRTFEVILDPATYLVSDTSFSGYLEPPNVNYTIAANAYEGGLNSRTLARFEIPAAIAVTDSAGVLRSDTMPRYFGGRIVIRVDTLRSSSAPVDIEAYQATQEWDAGSATWTLRVDSGGVRVPWSTAGGSPGARIGTVTWTEGDSIVIPVDSQTIVQWKDTANFLNGAVIFPATAGVRLRNGDLVLRADARSSIRDTVVTSTIRPPAQTFIFDPPVPASQALPRVGGVPGWRAFLRFRDGMDTLTVACPTVENCRVRISDASVTYAALLLQPVAAPPGFAPEDSMVIGTRLALTSAFIPIERSPLGDPMGLMPRLLPAARFTDPGGPPVEVPVTTYIRRLTTDSLSAPDVTSRYLALLPGVEGATFGFATFQSMPRLKLILTVATELQLR